MCKWDAVSIQGGYRVGRLNTSGLTHIHSHDRSNTQLRRHAAYHQSMLRESGTRVSDPTPIVESRGITKRFPGIIACERVDLRVYPGQIHALLGENGAGKTTLMHVLYGLQQPDAGEICIDGQPTVIRSPKDAIRAGIAMVFQHFTLIPSLTVAENIALAGPSSHLFLRHKWLAASVQELAEQYQLAVDPDSHVWQLSVGEQQSAALLQTIRQLRCLPVTPSS